ncbi:MAG: nitrous oxide reductase family maturation protein NosD [Candidatus Hermodarchaeota archaeon]
MNQKKINLTIISVILISSLNFVSNSKNNLGFSYHYSKIENESNLNYKHPHTSTLSSKIHINNNWTAAKAAGICTGNGTYSDPYVIKNFFIDAENMDNCIKIENSNAAFRIENCILINSRLEFVYNTGYASIYLLNCQNGVLTNNTCTNSYIGIYLSRDCSNISIVNNNCTSNIQTGFTVGIFLNGCSNNNLIGNECYGSDDGIYIIGRSNNVINNICSDNSNGIECMGCQNTIVGNDCSFNRNIGIFISSGYNPNDYNIISGNNCSYTRTGIYLGGRDTSVENWEISYNFCIWNSHGIEIWNTNNSKILNNQIVNSIVNGIVLDRCNSITIVGNSVNIIGPYAICLNRHSTRNIIFFNCFDSPFCGYDNGSNNRWDIGIWGNFWSNYEGLDGNGDGVGDVPYNIFGSARSQDKYPLMKCDLASEPPLENSFDIIISIASIIGGNAILLGLLITNRKDLKKVRNRHYNRKK